MSTRSHFDHTAPKSIAAQGVRVAHNISDQTRLAQRFAPRRFGARRLRVGEQSSDLPSYSALARAWRANSVRFECSDQRDRSRATGDKLHLLLFFRKGPIRGHQPERKPAHAAIAKSAALREGHSMKNEVSQNDIPKQNLAEFLAGNFRQDLLNEN